MKTNFFLRIWKNTSRKWFQKLKSWRNFKKMGNNRKRTCNNYPVSKIYILEVAGSYIHLWISYILKYISENVNMSKLVDKMEWYNYVNSKRRKTKRLSSIKKIKKPYEIGSFCPAYLTLFLNFIEHVMRLVDFKILIRFVTNRTLWLTGTNFWVAQ